MVITRKIKGHPVPDDRTLRTALERKSAGEPRKQPVRKAVHCADENPGENAEGWGAENQLATLPLSSMIGVVAMRLSASQGKLRIAIT